MKQMMIFPARKNGKSRLKTIYLMRVGYYDALKKLRFIKAYKIKKLLKMYLKGEL